MALAQQERYDLAHAAWQEALHFDPMHPEAHANLAMLAQISTTEVESLNFGAAQTMRFDCDVPSAAVSSLPVWEYSHTEYAALDSETAVVAAPVEMPGREEPDFPSLRQEPFPSEERRIKLPPLTGPPLGSIADTIVAAQEAKTQEPDAEYDTDFAHAEERREPTLRLDSRALKREHARLEAFSSSSRQISSPGWLRNLAVTGGAVVLAVALTMWGMGRFREPVGSVSSSTTETPPTTSASAIAPSETPPASMRSSIIVEPVPPIAAKVSGVRASTARTVKHKAVRDAPETRRHSEAKPAARLVAEEKPRVLRRHSEPSNAADRSVPRRPVTRSRPGRTEEDTFAAHHRSVHADNAEDWTDHIP